MPRAPSPIGRRSLLLLVIVAAVIGGAWWWGGPPRDPVYLGHRLSELIAADESPAYKPDESKSLDFVTHAKPVEPIVKWLAYTLEHGKHPVIRYGPRHFENAPLWIRQMLPGRWGGLRDWSDTDERVIAAELLSALEADAAPAFPVLVRCLESDDPEGKVAYEAAWTLQDAGPISWPIVHDTLEHGSSKARIPLLKEMFVRLELHKGGPGADEVAPAVAALIKGLHHSDPEVRQAAAYGLLNCKANRENDDRYDSAIPDLVQLVLTRDRAASGYALKSLAGFATRATASVPFLIEQLDHPDPGQRASAAQLLSSIDTGEKRSASRLRKMLDDPDADCRAAAKTALETLVGPN